MTVSKREMDALGLHHSAYRCRDAEETRAFWEDRIGFPLVMALKIDEHPTTGEAVSYMHIFFDIGSYADEPGQSNYLAYFDVPFRAGGRSGRALQDALGHGPPLRHAGRRP